jgi:hypothetical protein
VGSGSAANLTACTCGHITSLDLGLVTSAQYIATVGFTCSSGQGVADPAAGTLTLSGSLTTGQCAADGCASLP